MPARPPPLTPGGQTRPAASTADDHLPPSVRCLPPLSVGSLSFS